jgi:hypothetical protein
MVTLGGTSDPTALIPGDPAGIAEVAGQLYNYATLLTEAGNGLQRIDTSSGWQGSAADAFRARFQGQPSAWLEAGSCFSSAAKALDDYVPVLSWAQQEAAEAITQWHAGNKKAAQTILGNAASKAAGAAATATATIGQARDKAPQKPGFWSDVGGFFSSAWHGAEHAGEDALDGLASMGNAMITHPGADAGMLAGLLLTGVSAVGDAGGAVLDATGVGAILGVPLNAVSTAGVLAGGTLMMASAGDLASHAAGDDRVDPLQTGGGGGSGAPSQDPQLTPGTQEYDDYINELAKDPAKGGKINGATEREAQVAVRAEADGDLPGPVTRTPLNAEGGDEGDFTDGTGQKWEIKSSPDIKPSYSKGAGEPISTPQNDATFTRMINKELGQGQKVLLDPEGMSADRLAHLQEVVADNPEWQGQVVWGR